MAPPGLALPGSDHPSIKYPTGAPINLQCCPNKPNNVERMGYFSDNPLLRRLRSVSKDGEPHPCENGILEPKGAIFDNDPTLGQPRSSDPAEGSLSLVQQVQEPWNYEKEKIVRGPLDYLLATPGEDIRGQLITAFNQWLEVPVDRLDLVKCIVGLLHSASLLIDDIQDSSKLRRGLPVAYSIFGIAQTINSANYAYFLAQNELTKFDNDEAFKIYTEELIRLHRGQGMDLFWRDSLICPTDTDYLDMVANKAGGLFRLAVKLMQMESSSDRDCVPLVDLMGIIFQIRDDYQNLKSDIYTSSKGICDDITEGKYSFPIIHSIRSSPGNMQLLNILRQKSADDAVKKYAVSIIESTRSFKHCRDVLDSLIQRARHMVDEVDSGHGKGNGVKAILDVLELK